MKFKDIPIAPYNRYNKNKIIKLSDDYAYIEYDSECWDIKKINPDLEVELVSKCENCKKYQESCTGRMTMISETSQTILNEKYFATYVDEKDPQTFSCSNFEKKEG